MGNQTLPSPQRSEAVNQFLRCLGKIQVAEKSGQNLAPYIAQARQWLAIVKLTSPKEAETLELELNRTAGHISAQEKDDQTSRTSRLFLLRIAWLGVPFACLFMLAGPNIVVQVSAGICLAGLLVLIFLK